MINKRTIDRIIRLKLDPLSFYAVITILERSGELAKDLESYIDKYGIPNYSDLVDAGILKTIDGKKPSFKNVMFEEEYFTTRSEMFEMAEELWSRYPAALPLGDGGMFIARKGPDKQEVLKLYLERINYSPEKHKYVLEQLNKYIKLVLDRKINGHRIHDWISNEMWDIIPELVAASRGEFKTDI